MGPASGDRGAHGPARWRGWLARRLYLRIYVAVLASLLVFALLMGGLWRWALHSDDRPGTGELATELAADLLPLDAGRDAWQRTVSRWQARTGIDLTLTDAGGQTLASAGKPIAPDVLRDSEREHRDRGGWVPRRDGPPVWMVPLADGRRLYASRLWRTSGGRPPLPGFVGSLALVVLLIGVAVYPMVRRLTRRLESLQVAVEALGAGDLSTRVPVRGRDEVAALAESFNRAAQRIEDLVRSSRSLLANASHELRSPLARIRMAIELNGEGATSAASRDELRRNIAELDSLIDEILLASRLDATPVADDPARQRFESVDLAGLFAEEAARVGVPLDLIEPVPAGHEIRGDARLLRRLLRNLLENAVRHGGGEDSVQARLAHEDRQWCIEVLDRGAGVPADERERIFEPFYRSRGASEREGGVGLGLSLVRQIAVHHGGSVVCEGREGGGSRFIARLPDTTR